MKSKIELKRSFENGKIPTQEDFWEWMDSYWHREEDIDLGKIEYTNPEPTLFKVGGIPAGTIFDKMPLKELLDYMFYGKADFSSTEIKFKVDYSTKRENTNCNAKNCCGSCTG